MGALHPRHNVAKAPEGRHVDTQVQQAGVAEDAGQHRDRERALRRVRLHQVPLAEALRREASGGV